MALTRPEIVVAADSAALFLSVAAEIERCAARAIEERGSFRIALSGGSTPRGLYELLATADHAARVRWQAWEIFFGDERAVPPDDPHSNFRMADETLLSRVPLTRGQVHRMRGELGARAAAAEYERELGDAPLDLVLLGMGDDGHTASLFPGDAALAETERRVVAGRAPSAPHDRITLSFRALSEARRGLFLIAGERKAELVKRVIDEMTAGQPELVAARVAPRHGVAFHLDLAAARALGRSAC